MVAYRLQGAAVPAKALLGALSQRCQTSLSPAGRLYPIHLQGLPKILMRAMERNFLPALGLRRV